MPKAYRKKERPVQFHKKNSIAYLTLNRPDLLNTINKEMLDQLGHLLETIKSDDTVLSVIITGAGGKAFSAGADIEFFSSADPLEVRARAQLAVETYSRIEHLGKPVIAAINGYALGGGLELAEACTLRIAVNTAKLGHPEVRIGAIAGWGGTTRLPRLVGKGRAAELLLTGRMITAEEALSMGLLNRIVEPEDLMKESEALMQDILSQAPLAVKLTWEAMHKGLDMSLDESARLGADYFGLVAITEDFKTGTKAFLAKHPPVFKGK
ncbi:MAG: enoyl-CoA hydratase/isomerase family protein [Nitrospirae bacterium]|nr:enoyl-CoA hydratase/isomerase family protein [Nitrospirota bacterium]